MPNFVKPVWIAAMLAVSMLIMPACASVPGSGATPEQQYYEVKAQWNTVMSAVIVWAGTPLGQSNVDVLLKIQAVTYRVAGVLAEIDLAMCFQGIPTAFDPAPPAPDGCVALGGSVAKRRFEFAIRAITVAISEIENLQIRSGS